MGSVHVWSCEYHDHPGSGVIEVTHSPRRKRTSNIFFTKRLPNKRASASVCGPGDGSAQVRAAKARDMARVDAPVVRDRRPDNETGLATRHSANGE